MTTGKELSEYLKDYQTHSGNASSVSRQAAYAAIAIIWIFNENNSLPEGLIAPAVWIIIGLGSDFIQYIWASAAWGIFHTIQEINLCETQKNNVTAPSWLNWPTLFFFWGKLIAITIGYVFLLRYLLEKLNFNFCTYLFGNGHLLLLGL